MSILTYDARQITDAYRRWQCPFRYRGSRDESTVSHHSRMNTYLIFLTTRAPLWDYMPNRQWLNARSMQIIYTNGATIHAVLIEAEETLQQVWDQMGQTLCNFDDYEVIQLEMSVGLEDTGLSRWLESRDDWKAWSAAQQ